MNNAYTNVFLCHTLALRIILDIMLGNALDPAFAFPFIIYDMKLTYCMKFDITFELFFVLNP